MGNLIKAIPPARTLLQGLRAIGYSFETAVADILDNSITAEANNIWMYSDPVVENPYFLILDDGYGMNRKELENAMQFGSNREDRVDCEQDLGRFGLGLKSASLSQCKRFSVISSRYGRINGMAYDVDLIEESNDWILEELTQEQIEAVPFIDKLKELDSGTIVLWNKFDKMELESGEKFKETFTNTIQQTQKHLEYVFHRFYDAVKIYMNEKRLLKKDPFLTTSPKHQGGRPVDIPIENSKIIVTPHTLPYANSITADEKALLGNPKSIYDEQGFYIYRNKRLIIWGSWLHMGYKSELNKLARVQIDIPSSLDKMWMLDVKKSTAKIPDSFKKQINIALQDSIIKSTKVNRYRGEKEARVEKPIWNREKTRDGSVIYSIDRENPMIKVLEDNLGERENKLLEILLSHIECTIPKGRLLNDVYDTITIANTSDDMETEQLKEEVIDIANMYNGKDIESFLKEILRLESYNKIADKFDYILSIVNGEN